MSELHTHIPEFLSHPICAPAAEALAALGELQAVPVTLGERELWPTPHITTKAAAILRALGVPDPKARFAADLEANHRRNP